MKAPIAALLVLLTGPSLWAAPPSAPSALTLDLPRDAGGYAIGVEPQGGRFHQVIAPQAMTTGEYPFSTYAKRQGKSVLAIYATNQTLIPLEAPVARVEISGLRAGETRQRIGVKISRTSARTLIVTAEDLKYHAKLTVSLIANNDLRVARLKTPAPSPQPRKLQGIALGPNEPGTGLKQYIGYRSAGGIFTPVLYPGDNSATKVRTAYFSTTFPGQPNIDVRFFAGDSPYIEKARPQTRYLISGITPNGKKQAGVKLDFKVGVNGELIPAASQINNGAPLQVEKYSTAALNRLPYRGRAQPVAEVTFPGHIPATPEL